MYSFSSQPFENALTKLLQEKPDISFNEVITHPDISPAVRNEAKELLAFLQKPENIELSLEYIFSNGNEKDPLILKAKRNTVSVYSSVCFKLHEIVCNNNRFIEEFSKFPKSPELYKDNYIFGNFSRIVETLGRYSNGQFLKKIDGLYKFLADNINVMAARELLTRILTDFYQYLTPEEIRELAVTLCDALKEENAFFIASMIKESIREKTALLPHFQKRDILTKIMDAAVLERNSPFTTLIRTEIFVLLEILFNEKENLRSAIVPKYEKMMKFDLENIDSATSASLRVFTEHIPDYFPKFFESPPNVYLNQCIFSVIKKLSDEDLVYFVRDHKVFQKVSEVYGKEKLNGHIYELAKYLADNQMVLQNCRGWFRFKDNQMAEYEKKRQNRLKNRPKPVMIQRSIDDFDDIPSAKPGPKIYYIEDDEIFTEV